MLETSDFIIWEKLPCSKLKLLLRLFDRARECWNKGLEIGFFIIKKQNPPFTESTFKWNIPRPQLLNTCALQEHIVPSQQLQLQHKTRRSCMSEIYGTLDKSSSTRSQRPPHHHFVSSLSSAQLYPYLAFSMYSAVGFSYLAQKKRPELRASHEHSLLISSRRRLTEGPSMLVWAIISGRFTSILHKCSAP